MDRDHAVLVGVLDFGDHGVDAGNQADHDRCIEPFRRGTKIGVGEPAVERERGLVSQRGITGSAPRPSTDCQKNLVFAESPFGLRCTTLR